MHITFAASVVALVVLAAASRPSVGQRSGRSILITKRSGLVNPDGSVNTQALNAHIASVKAKILRGFENFERNTGTRHPSASQSIEKRGAAEPLTDNHNVMWYGTIAVGTPPKSFTVELDTGSGDLLLPASACGSTCNGHTLWDPSSSTTSKDLGRSFSTQYGGGSFSGEQYTDTVSIAGYTATAQTLDAATTYPPSHEISKFPADGIMGMAFQSLSSYGASPVFQTLVSEGQVTTPVFSFKLSSSGAELYIGGSDPSLYSGSFTYIPVTNQGYWEVNMDSIQGNSQTILSNVDSVIDTGTSLIIGNPSQVSSLYSTFGGTSIGNGLYTFPCDSFPTFSLTFGGTTFPIPPSAINLGTLSDSSGCVSGIAGADIASSFWIIGDVFLQGVYTTFDVGNSQVGFAKLA